MRISALIKEPLLPCEDSEKTEGDDPGSGLPRHRAAGSLILGSAAPRLGEISVSCFGSSRYLIR